MIDTDEIRTTTLGHKEAVASGELDELDDLDEIDRLWQENADSNCGGAVCETVIALRELVTRLENLYRQERDATKSWAYARAADREFFRAQFDKETDLALTEARKSK